MALKSATRSIPIAFVNVTDPVSSGLVASLAQPGANITGFTNFEIFDGRKMARAVKGHCVISPQDCGSVSSPQRKHLTSR